MGCGASGRWGEGGGGGGCDGWRENGEGRRGRQGVKEGFFAEESFSVMEDLLSVVWPSLWRLMMKGKES